MWSMELISRLWSYFGRFMSSIILQPSFTVLWHTKESPGYQHALFYHEDCIAKVKKIPFLWSLIILAYEYWKWKSKQQSDTLNGNKKSSDFTPDLTQETLRKESSCAKWCRRKKKVTGTQTNVHYSSVESRQLAPWQWKCSNMNEHIAGLSSAIKAIKLILPRKGGRWENMLTVQIHILALTVYGKW